MERNICIRLQANVKQIVECRKVVKELDANFTTLSNILSLTGNHVRLKILYLLHIETHLCVCDLSDILGMNVSAISQHLKKLKEKQLIYSRREAQIIYHEINKDKLPLLKPFFKLINGANSFAKKT